MKNSTHIELRIKEAKAYLMNRAAEVDLVLSKFWDFKHAEYIGQPDIIHEAFDLYNELTRGGKKLRAVLTILAYEACRHTNSPNSNVESGIHRAAGAVEILHNASLIHDDIMDRSELRRGKPTIYRYYANRYKSLFSTKEEAVNYGVALALNLGDHGQALAEQLLLSSGFPERLLLRAVSLLGSTTSDTVVGQFLDLENVSLDKITIEQVLQIYEYKTARYTVLCPLILGGILADAPEPTFTSIREYAIPIGIAFQIQDDTLDFLEDHSATRETDFEDLKEGKKTIMFQIAYSGATESDKQFLIAVHGNSLAKHSDLIRVDEIIAYTDARQISKKIANGLAEKAKEAIPFITSDPTSRDKLLLIAEYCINRND